MAPKSLFLNLNNVQGLVEKNTDCSSKETKFDFQHPYGRLQEFVRPVLGIQYLLPAFRHQVCTQYTYIHAYIQIYIHIHTYMQAKYPYI